MPSKPGSPPEHAFDGDGFPRPFRARRPIAFCANLDAEEELRTRHYQASHATLSAIQAQSARLLGTLLGPADRCIAPGATMPVEGLAGLCWCPTPRALATLEENGAQPAPYPQAEIVRTANHRAFAHALGDAFESRLVYDLWQLEHALQSMEDLGLGFLAKPGLGFAGRGHRRLSRMVSDADLRHLQRPLATEGLVVEPRVERVADFALHGFISPHGEWRLGLPTFQRCNGRGVWQDSRLATRDDLPACEAAALQESAEQTASALWAAGYHGPFGIDAFRYLDRRGRAQFRPRVEVNARFTMAWAIGYFARQP